MKTTVAAIDFGTSKIVTLVAENSGSHRCDIVGVSNTAYDGYLPEGWNNVAELDEKILASIKDVETQSGRKIQEINVGVPAAFTKVYPVEVHISLSGADPRVTSADVRRAFKAAEEKLGNIMGVVVHSSPAWFSVDDGKKTLEPVDLKGRDLGAYVSFVVADRFFIEEVNARLNRLGYRVSGFYSTAAGEAMLFLPEEDRDRTCMLIDVGYLSTDVMTAEGDALTFLHTIDIGGGLIAADLAETLDIPMPLAEERIKRRYTFGIDAPDQTFDLPAEGDMPACSFTRQQVTDIITSRVDKLVTEIQAALANAGIKLGDWSNIYFTGSGLGRNQGGKDYLAARMGRPVRDVPKRTNYLNEPSYSSSLGLLELIIDTIELSNQQSAGKPGALKDFFRGLLGG